MTTSISSSAAPAVIESVFSEVEKLALAGFLAGYSGQTRQAYALDLRQFTAWCRRRPLRLFAVRRADIELLARDLAHLGCSANLSVCAVTLVRRRRGRGLAGRLRDHPAHP